MGFVADEEAADPLLRRWLASGDSPLPARLWTDAWLAASAETASLRLVSLDADFARFPLTRRLHLMPDAAQ